jgi:hypothetical protein
MYLPSIVYRRAYGGSCRRFRGDRLWKEIEGGESRVENSSTEEPL